MQQGNNLKTFFDLVKVGLWEDCEKFTVYGLQGTGNVDWDEVYQLAEEQSVVGLVAAGIEHIHDVRVPQEVVLQFVGMALQIEQRNIRMNTFVAQLIEKLRKEDVYAILVKGQGVAQCYERPLWRSSGDVDLFLSDTNYQRASIVLKEIASFVDEEAPYSKHHAMTIDGWSVELHGTLRGAIKRIDHVVDEVQAAVFCNGNVRAWQNGNTQIFLPGPNEDVFLTFTHILQHFYITGIGLRQICDWCRLLYIYKKALNYRLLEAWIHKAGIMKEWKAFGAFAVVYLGASIGTIPFLDVSGNKKNAMIDKRLERKADKICEFVLESGNFGHNRNFTYKQKYHFIIRYTISFWLYTKSAVQRFTISPINAVMAWWAILKLGTSAAAKAISST